MAVKAKKNTKPVTEVKHEIPNGRYFESVGRRKESVARVRLFPKKAESMANSIIINGKPYGQYVSDPSLIEVIESPLIKLKSADKFSASVKVKGGGISGQAHAIQHGLARALVLADENFQKKMRKGGFLTRDSRVKERRKYGLKKARKAPQWSKR